MSDSPHCVSVANMPFSPRNRRATILYVDSPVGTGFSTLSNPDGYVTSEKVCLFLLRLCLFASNHFVCFN